MTGAGLLLRIDDLDSNRTRPAYVRDIFNTLNFLNIHWQEGPGGADDLTGIYSQQLRLSLYMAALDQLRLTGDLFACTCPRSVLDAAGGYPGTCRNKNISLNAAGVSWRLKADSSEPLTIHNFTGGVLNYNLPASMTDFIVRKKDGFPSYQLTSVVDDVFFGVDLIIRGEDLLPSTLAQLLLAKRLGYDDFQKNSFLFHSLIRDNRGRKLSKSAGDLSLASLIRNGAGTEEIYRLIGNAAGLDGELNSWESLAGQLLTRLP